MKTKLPQLSYLRVRVRKRNGLIAGIMAVFVAGVVLGNVWSNTQREGFERHETYRAANSGRSHMVEVKP